MRSQSTETATLNPYKASPSSADATVEGLTRGQAILVTLLACVLLLRGGLMVLDWAIQFSSGRGIDSHFSAAIFTKDAIYAFTALIGGILLLARHRISWWFAMAHWSWYIACEIVVVATGAALQWRVPIHHDPPALYRVMALTALLAGGGLSILLWRPIATACKAPVAHRFLAATVSIASSTLIAFAVNGWMSLR